MAQGKVSATMVRYANLPGMGWRRGTAVKNRPGVMVFKGQGIEAQNGVYQIRICRNGKTEYTSIENDLAKAEALFTRYQLTAHRDLINSKLNHEVVPEVKHKPTLAELAADYVRDKKVLDLSKESIRLYERTLTGFLSVVKKTYPDEVTKQDILTYVVEALKKHRSLRTPQGYCHKTRAMRYTCLRGFLASCGVAVGNLIDAATHKQLKAERGVNTEPYTEAELKKFFAVCTPYYRVVFTLLLATGMRFREANHLLWSNIKWDERKITIPGRQRINKGGKLQEFRTKNKKGRPVPMFASLWSTLKEWREQHPNAVYVVGSTNNSPNSHWLEYGKKFWREAGLDCGVCDGCAGRGKWATGRLRIG